MLGPALYESLLARRGVPIVYDFDDAIWLRQPGSVNGAFAALRFPGKTRTICRAARAVTVGNEYLADWARRFNAAVSVVPTSIDLGRFPVQPELGADDPLVIVWTGSQATLPHLELLRGALERVGARRKVVLKVICDRAPARPFPGVELRFVPWRAESEAEDVGAAHLGIMPLPDDEFARGKCACKALQYMATGRPALASPVGVNRDIIRSGDNGLLCASDDEWVAAIESLAASPERRRTLGAAGRRTVESGFSAESSAARFADAARAAVGSR
jgi:glycosyltransferase involved in cell wall biosynthesis